MAERTLTKWAWPDCPGFCVGRSVRLARGDTLTMQLEMSLLGESRAMRTLRDKLAPVARARRTTLITGPTGTGKELVARALHAASAHPERPFVVVHCGALTDTLAEDELFGHARGAFTGARDARSGLVRTAHAGTLFLDEVDSLSPRVQSNLLRFLETGEMRSVGSDRLETADAWVLAATNADLQQQVRAGRFRQDLLYRLDVLRIDLPPLRLRDGDAELLAYHFLHEVGGGTRRFGPSALAALRKYSWPGNVRELKHRVERAVLLCEAVELEAEDLGLDIHGDALDDNEDSPALTSSLWQLVSTEGLSLSEALAYCERAIIDAALRAENGNRTRAAERLRIHLRTIFKKLQRP